MNFDNALQTPEARFKADARFVTSTLDRYATQQGKHDRADRWRDLGDQVTQLPRQENLTAAQENPDSIAPAVGAFARFIPETNEHHTAEAKRLAEAGHRVFSEACAKVFPGERVSLTLLDSELDQIDASLDGVPKALQAWVEVVRTTMRNIESAGGAKKERAENPARLLGNLTVARDMGAEAISDVVMDGESDGETNPEALHLSGAVLAVYKLDQLVQGLSKESATDQEPVRSTEGTPATPQSAELPTPPVGDMKKLLNESKASNVAEVQALMTPEVKAAVLAEFLVWVDSKIASGKHIGGPVRADQLSQILPPNTARAPFWAMPLVAATGRWTNEGAMNAIKVREYARVAFGYDLAADQKRAADLKEWTSVLD